jgi:hypothetical protein
MSSTGSGPSPMCTALIEWFAQTPPMRTQDGITIDSLSNGSQIWEALCWIDPYNFQGSLPKAGLQTTKERIFDKQNLAYIYKQLAAFISHHNGRLPDGPMAVSLQSTSKSEDHEEIAKVVKHKLTNNNMNPADYFMQLLKMVLFVAIHAEENQEFIEPMLYLDNQKQILLQEAIVEVKAPIPTSFGKDSNSTQFGSPSQEENKPEESSKSASVDRDLYWEEQLAILTRENEKLVTAKRDLQKDLRDQTDRNTRLLQHNNNLQAKLSAADEKLEQYSGNLVGESVIKDIEGRLKEQEEHIASQETQLGEFSKEIDDLKNENSKLRVSHDKYQPLQDAYDELKVERDQLLRKANAIDKYKAKLQAAQEQEKEYQYLRNDLEEARELNRLGNEAIEHNKLLQKQIYEYQRVIPNIEQQLSDNQRMREQTENLAQHYKRELDQANAQFEQDQATIRDLLDQIQGGLSHPEGAGNLENELVDSHRHESRESQLVTNIVLAWSRFTYISRTNDLRIKNEVLERANTDAAARLSMLEQMLIVARGRNKDLERQLDDYARSKEPEERFKGLPSYFTNIYTYTDKSGSNKQAKEDTTIELAREREAFSRRMSEDEIEGNGKVSKHIQSEISSNNEKVTIIDRDELLRLQNLERTVEGNRFGSEETEKLQTRVQELESQLGRRHILLQQAIGGLGLADKEIKETMDLIRSTDSFDNKVEREVREAMESQISTVFGNISKNRELASDYKKVVDTQSFYSSMESINLEEPRSKRNENSPSSKFDKRDAKGWFWAKKSKKQANVFNMDNANECNLALASPLSRLSKA